MAKSDATVEIERIAWNVGEAAAALGINRAQMGALVRIGAVPHIQLGERVLIGKAALERWLTDGCLSNTRQVGALADQRQTPPTRLRRAAH